MNCHIDSYNVSDFSKDVRKFAFEIKTELTKSCRNKKKNLVGVEPPQKKGKARNRVITEHPHAIAFAKEKNLQNQVQYETCPTVNINENFNRFSYCFRKQFFEIQRTPKSMKIVLLFSFVL